METKKTEFSIGEEFQYGLIRLKCVEDVDASCNGCYFLNREEICHGDRYIDCKLSSTIEIGGCSEDTRSDKKDVIFINVEE